MMVFASRSNLVERSELIRNHRPGLGSISVLYLSLLRPSINASSRLTTTRAKPQSQHRIESERAQHHAQSVPSLLHSNQIGDNAPSVDGGRLATHQYLTARDSRNSFAELCFLIPNGISVHSARTKLCSTRPCIADYALHVDSVVLG